MEVLEENPREDFEWYENNHKLEMQTNLLLWLTQHLFSDETEQALFDFLWSKPENLRLKEINKWIWFIVKYKDDFMAEAWAGLAYTWDIKELEAYFQEMDDIERQQKKEEFAPINRTLQSLKWVNSEVILNWFQTQLKNLYSQIVN